MSHEFMGLLRGMPAEAVATVMDRYTFLLAQFLPSAGLPDPHLLFLDNNVLQDLRKEPLDHKRKLRACAVRIFADFLVSHSALKVELALPPAILYEFAHRTVPETESQWQVITHGAHRTLGVLGMPIRSFGSVSFFEARDVLARILHDEAVIGRAISRIEATDWTIALRKGPAMLIPFSLSQRLAPDALELRYFNLGCVRSVLAALIERLILTNRENDPHVRKTFYNESAAIVAALSKIERGVLQGLGDIELLSLCAVGPQFRKDQADTRTALTFDLKLCQALALRKGFFATHDPIVCGRDTATDIHRKLDELFEGERRLTAVEERRSAFLQRAAKYFDHLEAGLPERDGDG